MSFGTYKMDGYRTHKSLKNDNGEIEITVPRDRNGDFDPMIVLSGEFLLPPHIHYPDSRPGFT